MLGNLLYEFHLRPRGPNGTVAVRLSVVVWPVHSTHRAAVLVPLAGKLLCRILKVGVQNFKQGVQGSNVHVLFNPASPRRSPFLSRETPRRSPISRSRC